MQQVEAIAKELGWSNERLALFTKLVVEYRRETNIENYLRVRHEFPEAQIQVAHLAGLDPLFALQDELKKAGIDPQLIAAALDGTSPALMRGLCVSWN
jgi:hypothetical protein